VPNIKEPKFSNAVRCKFIILKRGRPLVFEVNKIGSVCYSIKVGESFDKYFFFWKLLLRDDSKLRINVQALPFMTRTGCCEVVDYTIVIGRHSREVFVFYLSSKIFLRYLHVEVGFFSEL
jgi:hypothetical protein